MDLSWGNRPSQDLQIVTYQAAGNENSCMNKKCVVEKCQATVSGSAELYCQDHLWLFSNIKVWKLVNIIVVLLNISGTIVVVWGNFDLFLPFLILLTVRDIGSLALMILADITYYTFASCRLCLARLLRTKAVAPDVCCTQYQSIKVPESSKSSDSGIYNEG